jgi:hypothetical protein
MKTEAIEDRSNRKLQIANFQLQIEEGCGAFLGGRYATEDNLQFAICNLQFSIASFFRRVSPPAPRRRAWTRRTALPLVA